jgi:sucrose phosphorylase
MAWRHGDYYCHLFVDLNFKTVKVTYTDVETGESRQLEC